MTLHDRVEINPKILLAKAVIKGTRTTVTLVLRKLAEGADERALLEAYPHLAKDDVRAALRYAADALAHEEVALPEADHGEAHAASSFCTTCLRHK